MVQKYQIALWASSADYAIELVKTCFVESGQLNNIHNVFSFFNILSMPFLCFSHPFSCQKNRQIKIQLDSSNLRNVLLSAC